MSESESGRVEEMQTVDAGSKEDKKLEVIAIVILAIASVFTAWSGFQATKWSGVQATNYSQAGARRTEAGTSATVGIIFALNTQSNFNSWLDATSAEDERLATVYLDRLENEIPEAWDAWLALDPANNEDAPQSPLLMPEYEFFTAEQTADLELQADDHFQTGQDANQTADDYVLATVFFAVALFFSGISTGLNFRVVRIALLVLAATAVLVGGSWVVSMPIEI